MGKFDNIRSKLNTQKGGGVNLSTHSVVPASEIPQSVIPRPVRPTQILPELNYDITQSPLLRQIAANPAPHTPVQDVIAQGARNIAKIPGVKQTLSGLGKAIEFVEGLPVINEIGGALANSYNQLAETPVGKPSSWIAQARKNIKDLAVSDSSNAPLIRGVQSIVEGVRNPEEAKAREAELIAKQTQGMGPVAKFGTSALVQTATDPLSLIPMAVPTINTASKGVSRLRELAAARKPVQSADDLLRDVNEANARGLAENDELLRSNTETPASTETFSPKSQGNWFTNLFGNQGVGISAFNSSKGTGRAVSSKDSIVGKKIVNSNEGALQSVKSALTSAHRALVDDLTPFKDISRGAYETAMDSRRASNLSNNIIGDTFVTPEGINVGQGMSSIFKKVARGKDKDFLDYLIKRDAAARVARGERVYDEEITVLDPTTREQVPLNNETVLRREVENLEKSNPDFKTLGKEWNQFTDNLLQHYGVDMGMLTPETKKIVQDARPDYIKMVRQFSRNEKPKRNVSGATGNSFSGQRFPLQRASKTGSGRKIVDPRKTMAEYVGKTVQSSMRNRAMQEMYRAIEADPESFKGIAEIIPEDITKRSLDDINKILQEEGLDGLIEKLDTEYSAAFKKADAKGENLVTVFIDGKPVKIRITNPELINAVTGLGPQATGLLSTVLGQFSNATKRGATGVLAPTFGLASGSMDIIQSAIQAKNPAKQVAYTTYALLSGIGDKLGVPGLRKMAEEYRLSGGQFSSTLKGESALNKNVRNMTRYPIFSRQNLVKQGINAVSSPFKVLEGVANIVENAPRIAASKIKLNELGGTRTPENVREAMSAGREATVNYLRRGTYGRELENLVPYYNAAVQGSNRILRGFKNNPVRTAAAVGGLVVLPKLYEYSQFSDDPDYQKIPKRELMRNLIVSKNDDGSFVKIPIDPAYNSFGEVTIEALRRFKDNDPQAFKDTAYALSEAWLPPIVSGALQGSTQGTGPEGSLVGALNSTVAAPAVAIASNKSFTGSPIESAAVADRSPANRYDERTTAVAKKIGELIGASPMKTDYLIRSYGGDIARLGLPMTSDVGAGTPRNTIFKRFILDPVLTNNLSNDFYGSKKQLSQAYRDNQELNVPLPKWYDDELRKEITSTAKGSLNAKVKDLTDKKKEISANPNLSKEAKAMSIRELQAQINNIYADINYKMYSKGIPTKAGY